MDGISIFQEELEIRIFIKKTKQDKKPSTIWKCWQLVLKTPYEFKRNCCFFFRCDNCITYFSYIFKKSMSVCLSIYLIYLSIYVCLSNLSIHLCLQLCIIYPCLFIIYLSIYVCVSTYLLSLFLWTTVLKRRPRVCVLFCFFFPPCRAQDVSSIQSVCTGRIKSSRGRNSFWFPLRMSLPNECVAPGQVPEVFVFHASRDLQFGNDPCSPAVHGLMVLVKAVSKQPEIPTFFVGSRKMLLTDGLYFPRNTQGLKNGGEHS